MCVQHPEKKTYFTWENEEEVEEREEEEPSEEVGGEDTWKRINLSDIEESDNEVFTSDSELRFILSLSLFTWYRENRVSTENTLQNPTQTDQLSKETSSNERERVQTPSEKERSSKEEETDEERDLIHHSTKKSRVSPQDAIENEDWSTQQIIQISENPTTRSGRVRKPTIPHDVKYDWPSMFVLDSFLTLI